MNRFKVKLVAIKKVKDAYNLDLFYVVLDINDKAFTSTIPEKLHDIKLRYELNDMEMEYFINKYK
jgi:hypothetical protein